MSSTQPVRAQYIENFQKCVWVVQRDAAVISSEMTQGRGDGEFLICFLSLLVSAFLFLVLRILSSLCKDLCYDRQRSYRLGLTGISALCLQLFWAPVFGLTLHLAVWRLTPPEVQEEGEVRKGSIAEKEQLWSRMSDVRSRKINE